MPSVQTEALEIPVASTFPLAVELLFFLGILLLIYHVKWVPCHHYMARPEVVDGGDGLQMWKLTGEQL